MLRGLERDRVVCFFEDSGFAAGDDLSACFESAERMLRLINGEF